jgi:amino acid transporter
MAENKRNKMGFLGIVSIGIGGMVGGGIFAVLGLAVELAHGGTPVAFLVAGFVALLTSYSYAKLSVAYPSEGGTVEFINQAFGEGMLTGSLNVLLWISYVIMLSLYAFAFGSYGSSFFIASLQPIMKHILISGIIIILTLLNGLGSTFVGEAEEWIVGFKLGILILFIAIGFWGISTANLKPDQWTPLPHLLAGGMIIFLAYEGFELISNSAGDVKNASKIMPKAFYTSVIFVIVLYALVSAVTVGNLPVDKIVAARDYALAEAAKPFLGPFGFTLIAIAALLSTGSAINATLYGTARVSYIIAKDGELPEVLERKIWKRPIEGLLITAGLALFVSNLFDLSSISLMGSAGFLIIFAAVNLANAKLSSHTKGMRGLSYIGMITCLGALGTLLWQRVTTASDELLIFAALLILSVAIEGIYRAATGRSIRSKFNRAPCTKLE